MWIINNFLPETPSFWDDRGCPKSKANLFTFLKKDDSIKE
jgi:hypothetical protein